MIMTTTFGCNNLEWGLAINLGKEFELLLKKEKNFILKKL
jgi:hypothetical protein